MKTLYGVLGAAGLAGFCWGLHLYLSLPGDGPADIGFALVFMVMAALNALPAAGLAALVLMRTPSVAAKAALWIVGLGVPVVWTEVAMGTWRDDLLMMAILAGTVVGALLPLGAVVALFASMLATLRRGWIATWLVGSVLVLVLDVLVLVLVSGVA